MNTNMCIDSRLKAKGPFIVEYIKETEVEAESLIMATRFMEWSDAKRWFDYFSYCERKWAKGEDWEILQDTENCFEACKSKNNYWDSYIRIEWEQVD